MLLFRIAAISVCFALPTLSNAQQSDDDEYFISSEYQLAILRQGVEVWNQWREANPNVDIDLQKQSIFQVVRQFVFYRAYSTS